MKASGRRFLASVEEAQVTSCELLVDLNFSQPAIACLLRLWHCQNSTHLFYRRALFIVDMVLIVFGKITRKKKVNSNRQPVFDQNRIPNSGDSLHSPFSGTFFSPARYLPVSRFSWLQLLQTLAKVPATSFDKNEPRTTAY